MSEVHTIAILYAAEGKMERCPFTIVSMPATVLTADRMQSLLAQQCKRVHENEEYTLRFLVTEPINPISGETAVAEPRDHKPEELVMIETYKSKEALLQHEEEPYFKEVFGLFMEENIMAKAPFLIRTVSAAGFDIDRKLI
ncbi:hypothetical protein B0A55_04515 [Friedmanniomyces simplex]|uniref:ABM domain-containing protein n=1 Tax=Friedmanniomyces simplex TaxID=329884 RepID=A0A4U0XED7_9PEZI|nr:hypothetical protein B0A55_04515 [Friedmanniomyces simplex]